MGNDQQKLTPEEIKSRQIQRVDQELRRKLKKGVQFNMKVVIRGDRNTGKTSLLRRLQGLPFSQAYMPSEQIQTAHIHWNYKSADDTVLVEVWDVVDQARPKAPNAAPNAQRTPAKDLEDDVDDENDQNKPDPTEVLQRKMSQFQQPAAAIPDGSHTVNLLDASLIDVYKGANAAIFIFDITKKWTFEYVKNEVKKVPKGCEIVLLANYFDLYQKRVVTQQEIDALVKTLASGTRCIESCMKNCYGLKTLYTYFDIPFLRMKIKSLRDELQIMEDEYKNSVQEVDTYISFQNYDNFCQLLKDTKKKPIQTTPFAEEIVGNKKIVSSAPPPQQPQSPLPQQVQAAAAAAAQQPKADSPLPKDAKKPAAQNPAAPAAPAAADAQKAPAKQQQQATLAVPAAQAQKPKQPEKKPKPDQKKKPSKSKPNDITIKGGSSLEEFEIGVDDSFFGEEGSEEEDTYASTAITTLDNTHKSEDPSVGSGEEDNGGDRPIKDADVEEDDFYIQKAPVIPPVKQSSPAAPVKQAEVKPQTPVSPQQKPAPAPASISSPKAAPAPAPSVQIIVPEKSVNNDFTVEDDNGFYDDDADEEAAVVAEKPASAGIEKQEEPEHEQEHEEPAVAAEKPRAQSPAKRELAPVPAPSSTIDDHAIGMDDSAESFFNDDEPAAPIQTPSSLVVEEPTQQADEQAVSSPVSSGDKPKKTKKVVKKVSSQQDLSPQEEAKKKKVVKKAAKKVVDAADEGAAPKKTVKKAAAKKKTATPSTPSYHDNEFVNADEDNSGPVIDNSNSGGASGAYESL